MQQKTHNKDVDIRCTPHSTFYSDISPVLPELPETTSNEYVTGSSCLLSSVVGRIFVSFHFHVFEGASEYIHPILSYPLLLFGVLSQVTTSERAEGSGRHCL